MNYQIKSYKLINKGEGYFKINISNYGKLDVTCFEIFLYLQEYQPKLYQFCRKYEPNYMLMFFNLIDIGIEIKSIIESYINNIIFYRLERDFLDKKLRR